MKYAAFHIGYDGGQRLFLGSDESLVLELEALGGGLDPQSPWNFGGPLLLQRDASPTRILGWIRGTTGRSNAWEAWGIVISSAIDLTCWPWYAALLVQPDATALSMFGDRLVQGAIAKQESLPPGTAAHVATAYAGDTSASTIRIQITTPAEALVMPWLWLLGPKEPSTATIGPPRALRAIVRRPLAYEPLIESEPESHLLVSSCYIDDVISLIERGHQKIALDAITNLRSLPAEQRRERLSANVGDVTTRLSEPMVTEVEAKPEKEKEAVGISIPPPEVASRKSETSPKSTNSTSKKRVWVLPNDPIIFRANIIIGLLLAILLIVSYATFRGDRTNKLADTSTAETAAAATAKTSPGTDTSITTGATMTSLSTTEGQMATCDMQDSAKRRAVLGRFAAYAQQQKNVAAAFAQLTTDASGQWNDSNKARIAAAARQLFLRERCGSNLTLDGFAGPSTMNAICSTAEWSTLKTNSDAALMWLCQRFNS
jgi:hypothetical protein